MLKLPFLCLLRSTNIFNVLISKSFVVIFEITTSIYKCLFINSLLGVLFMFCLALYYILEDKRNISFIKLDVKYISFIKYGIYPMCVTLIIFEILELLEIYIDLHASGYYNFYVKIIMLAYVLLCYIIIEYRNKEFLFSSNLNNIKQRIYSPNIYNSLFYWSSYGLIFISVYYSITIANTGIISLCVFIFFITILVLVISKTSDNDFLTIMWNMFWSKPGHFFLIVLFTILCVLLPNWFIRYNLYSYVSLLNINSNDVFIVDILLYISTIFISKWLYISILFIFLYFLSKVSKHTKSDFMYLIKGSFSTKTIFFLYLFVFIGFVSNNYIFIYIPVFSIFSHICNINGLKGSQWYVLGVLPSGLGESAPEDIETVMPENTEVILPDNFWDNSSSSQESLIDNSQNIINDSISESSRANTIDKVLSDYVINSRHRRDHMLNSMRLRGMSWEMVSTEYDSTRDYATRIMLGKVKGYISTQIPPVKGVEEEDRRLFTEELNIVVNVNKTLFTDAFGVYNIPNIPDPTGVSEAGYDPEKPLNSYQPYGSNLANHLASLDTITEWPDMPVMHKKDVTFLTQFINEYSFGFFKIQNTNKGPLQIRFGNGRSITSELFLKTLREC